MASDPSARSAPPGQLLTRPPKASRLSRWSALDEAGVEAERAALNARWGRLSRWLYPLLFGIMGAPVAALLAAGHGGPSHALAGLAFTLACIAGLGFVIETIGEIQAELFALGPAPEPARKRSALLARASAEARCQAELAEASGRRLRRFDLHQMEIAGAPAMAKRAQAKARRERASNALARAEGAQSSPIRPDPTGPKA